MRRFLALSRSAALEALSEPLSAVVFLAGLLAVHLLPVLHCHQFGDPERLARECGFSAVLVFGLIFATAAAVRVIGREIASGTAAAALARPVSRTLFFCAKTCGVLHALGLFAVAAAAATLAASAASGTGAARMADGGGRVWGVGFAAGAGLTVAGFVAAAAANRFFRVRFCRGACLFLTAAQVAGLAVTAGASAVPVAWRILPAFAVLTVGCAAFVALAAALAVRLPPAAVTTAVAGSVVAAFLFPVRAVLPDLGVFWRVDDFAGGGAPEASVLAAAGAAGLALIALWMTAGAALMARKEIS